MAIKASELRLENLISYNGEPMPIFSIDRSCRSFYTINDIQINRNTGCTIKGGEDVFNPIPLTEKWLMRFGLKKNTDGPSYNWTFNIGNKHIAPHGDNRYELTSFGIEGKPSTFCHYTVNDYWAAKTCHYVHQVQNLFYALTGEELQIKEV